MGMVMQFADQTDYLVIYEFKNKRVLVCRDLRTAIGSFFFFGMVLLATGTGPFIGLMFIALSLYQTHGTKQATWRGYNLAAVQADFKKRKKRSG